MSDVRVFKPIVAFVGVLTNKTDGSLLVKTPTKWSPICWSNMSKGKIFTNFPKV
jgi:hypothetical protein